MENQNNELELQLEAFAMGTLSPGDVAKLHLQAEGDIDLQLTLDTLTPLGSAFEEQMFEQAQRALATQASPAPTPVRWWQRLTFRLGTPALVAAFALLLVVGPALQSPTLPPYDVQIEGHTKQKRSEATGDTFGPGSRIQLHFSPHENATDVQATAWVRQGSEVHALTTSPDISPSGAISWRIPREEIPFDGAVDVLVGIGFGAPPTHPDAIGQWSLHTIPVQTTP